MEWTGLAPPRQQVGLDLVMDPGEWDLDGSQRVGAVWRRGKSAGGRRAACPCTMALGRHLGSRQGVEQEVGVPRQGWAITGFYPVDTETETNPENTRPIDTTRD